ncbi:MAG: penicillin-insensitive murein endopeptidase [Hyphomicrobium sp.]|jgi:penicillin-insensitive murein endopeptidase
MSLIRGLAACALIGAPLLLAPAMADEIGELLRTWSGPAAATADAAKDAAAPQSSQTPQPGGAPAAALGASVPTSPPAAVTAPAPAVAPVPVPATRPADAALPSGAPAGTESAPVLPVAATSAGVGTPEAKLLTKDATGKGAAAKDAAAKNKKPPMPAKQLFGAVKSPADLAVRSIGWYAKGCLSGAKPISVDGPAWQVMRLSRNRNWGHPKLIAIVERLGNEAKSNKEWSGLLIGDISQPRGGPMLTGHASHQVGLDADIWLTPMPDRKLSREEREDISATSMLADNEISVDRKVFGDGQVKLIKRAASYPEIERVLVHPAIKKALCEAAGTDRAWLSKVRPYFGHYYHFHMRIGCPEGSTNCKAQPPVPGDDGCGAELKDWLKRVAPKPPAKDAAKPETPSKPEAKKNEITLADLPAECRSVLLAGGNKPPTEPTLVDKSKDAAPVKHAESHRAATPVKAEPATTAQQD